MLLKNQTKLSQIRQQIIEPIAKGAMEVSLLTPWLKAFDSVALSRVEWGIKRGVKVGTKYHIGVLLILKIK